MALNSPFSIPTSKTNIPDIVSLRSSMNAALKRKSNSRKVILFVLRLCSSIKAMLESKSYSKMGAFLSLGCA